MGRVDPSASDRYRVVHLWSRSQISFLTRRAISLGPLPDPPLPQAEPGRDPTLGSRPCRFVTRSRTYFARGTNTRCAAALRRSSTMTVLHQITRSLRQQAGQRYIETYTNCDEQSETMIGLLPVWTPTWPISARYSVSVRGLATTSGPLRVAGCVAGAATTSTSEGISHAPVSNVSASAGARTRTTTCNSSSIR